MHSGVIPATRRRLGSPRQAARACWIGMGGFVTIPGPSLVCGDFIRALPYSSGSSIPQALKGGLLQAVTVL